MDKLYSGEITDGNETILVGIFSTKEMAKDAVKRYWDAENLFHNSKNWFYGYEIKINEVIVDTEVALNKLRKKKKMF